MEPTAAYYRLTAQQKRNLYSAVGGVCAFKKAAADAGRPETAEEIACGTKVLSMLQRFGIAI